MRRRSMTALLLAPVLLLIAAFALPVVRAGGGCHGPVTPPGDGDAGVVKIDRCMFYPTVARVLVGTSVRFVNTGDVPHNVTGVSGAWSSGDLASGAEYRHAFDVPGVYPFACTLHPGMNGAVVVGDGALAEAQLTSSAPAEASTPTTDPVPIAIVGLAALGVGLALGAVVTRLRARSPS